MTAERTDLPPKASRFHYETPEFEKVKASRTLGRTETAFLKVQIFKTGGEVSLHSHQNLDGFWMVLRGQARFYTTADELVADLGPMEGIVIPRGFPYWFEKAGNEQLEILQFDAATEPIHSKEDMIKSRIDYVPRKFARGRADVADLSVPIGDVMVPSADHISMSTRFS